jgi:uracil-DNA glycosylase
VRRLRILEEMGLGPVWRRRAGPLPPADEPASDRVSPSQDVVPDIDSMSWEDLREAVRGCTACTLCQTRNATVFGVGDKSAELMLVGEAPGQEEDASGEPFVGQAGRLLDNMLASVGMSRQRGVYIANVLKCRPPENRNPSPGEMAQCTPFLRRQIALVQPRLIVAMGRFAVQSLLLSEASIASLRGRVLAYQQIPLIVTYHPAYLLRTPQDKGKAWEDLLFMSGQLGARPAPESRPGQPSAEPGPPAVAPQSDPMGGGGGNPAV